MPSPRIPAVPGSAWAALINLHELHGRDIVRADAAAGAPLVAIQN